MHRAKNVYKGTKVDRALYVSKIVKRVYLNGVIKRRMVGNMNG